MNKDEIEHEEWKEVKKKKQNCFRWLIKSLTDKKKKNLKRKFGNWRKLITLGFFLFSSKCFFLDFSVCLITSLANCGKEDYFQN